MEPRHNAGAFVYIYACKVFVSKSGSGRVWLGRKYSHAHRLCGKKIFSVAVETRYPIIITEGKMSNRSLFLIAREIEREWKNPSAYALPYIRAMKTLNDKEDYYMLDSGVEIIARFLNNAGGWRGDVARRVKSELKSIILK